MISCRVCGSSRLSVLLDCGSQPLCNRYLSTPEEEDYRHELVLGNCADCGLVQLVNRPVPVEEISPRYEWISYREPEAHLDRLADALAALPGISEESVCCGVSFKDDSLLARLRGRGLKSWRVDPVDLAIERKGAGVETIQDRLDRRRCSELAERYGRADIVVARHILEHAYDTRELAEGLKLLLKPGGFLALEVPDCGQALESRDYSTLWEEHIVYFTAETFRNYCAATGFTPVRVELVPYALENSIVGILRCDGPRANGVAPPPFVDGQSDRAAAFGNDFARRRASVRQRLADFHATQGRIALLGAGHLSCMFLNLFDLNGWVDFVADDDPNKQGLFMPGSRLPIRGSRSLIEENIRLCLLGVNPQVEDAVTERHAGFIARGGTLASIFSASPRALPL